MQKKRHQLEKKNSAVFSRMRSEYSVLLAQQPAIHGINVYFCWISMKAIGSVNDTTFSSR